MIPVLMSYIDLGESIMSNQQSNTVPRPANGFNVTRHNVKRPKLTIEQKAKLILAVLAK